VVPPLGMSLVKPVRRKTTTSKPRQRGLREGYRSGLEEVVHKQLADAGIHAEYENLKIKYEKPARTSTYTPDFELPNGIIIETKGRFESDDRQKHLLIKAQCPEYDIRFVFSNSKNRISKQSKTTYAMWCEKYGFLYADRVVPMAWIKEKKHG